MEHYNPKCIEIENGCCPMGHGYCFSPPRLNAAMPLGTIGILELKNETFFETFGLALVSLSSLSQEKARDFVSRAKCSTICPRFSTLSPFKSCLVPIKSPVGTRFGRCRFLMVSKYWSICCLAIVSYRFIFVWFEGWVSTKRKQICWIVNEYIN